MPGAGDYPLFPQSVYAIELNTTVAIPQWDKDIRIMLEEAGYWRKGGFHYIYRKTERTNSYNFSSKLKKEKRITA